MTEDQRWWVPLRGEQTADATAAVRIAGGQPTGLSHTTSSGGVERHGFSVYITAASAAEAVCRLRAAFADVNVYVPDEDEVTAAPEV